MISELMVRLAQTVHLSCTNTNTIQTDGNEIPLEPRHLGVLSGAVKMISKPCLEQTMHLSCTNTNTISKRTENGFHLSLITEEFYRVRSKWFPSLVWNKPCTYLALILTLSPNGPKQDYTWASSPRSSIGCVQNDFRDQGTFHAKLASILRQD